MFSERNSFWINLFLSFCPQEKQLQQNVLQNTWWRVRTA